MHTALEITARLAEAFPGDPCKGDFALYGLGILDIPSARSLRSRAGDAYTDAKTDFISKWTAQARKEYGDRY